MDFITKFKITPVSTYVRHWSVTRASSIQLIPSHIIFLLCSASHMASSNHLFHYNFTVCGTSELFSDLACKMCLSAYWYCVSSSPRYTFLDGHLPRRIPMYCCCYMHSWYLNTMEQSSPWEANSHTLSQEDLLWNPKVHYRVHKSLPLGPNLSQVNPAPTPTTYLFNVKLNIILPYSHIYSFHLWHSSHKHTETKEPDQIQNTIPH